MFLIRMDTSLTELETDIGRLTQQQEQIRRQFFLHGDQSGGSGGFTGGPHSNNDTAKRKTWTVPSGGGSGGGPPPSSSSQQAPQRSQWGSPKPYGNNANNSDSDNPAGASDSSSRVVYNGEVRTATAPNLHSSRSGDRSSSAGANNNAGVLSYTSSFRLHSNADTQGNRLFGRQQTTYEQYKSEDLLTC